VSYLAPCDRRGTVHNVRLTIEYHLLHHRTHLATGDGFEALYGSAHTGSKNGRQDFDRRAIPRYFRGWPSKPPPPPLEATDFLLRRLRALRDEIRDLRHDIREQHQLSRRLIRQSRELSIVTARLRDTIARGLTYSVSQASDSDAHGAYRDQFAVGAPVLEPSRVRAAGSVRG
jgi:hypothetical protein